MWEEEGETTNECHCAVISFQSPHQSSRRRHSGVVVVVVIIGEGVKEQVRESEPNLPTSEKEMCVRECERERDGENARMLTVSECSCAREEGNYNRARSIKNSSLW